MGKPQRLELTWYNKNKALIPTETGKYGYTWVDPSDPCYCETRTFVMDEFAVAALAVKFRNGIPKFLTSVRTGEEK